LALILLGRTGGVGAETALRTGLVDAEAMVCAEAVLGLGRRRATIAPADSQRLLAHDDEHVRGATAHALFLASDRSAVKWLRPLLTDPHPFVRAVAAESLSQWGEPTVKPPAGFSAAAILSYPF
jgi:HEAT repeat protein